ncbi:ABC transporter ATP-binding protein [Paracidovorax konjaci]|uniref:Amino acid/amide ABC transporter ATP-binding protein 2, HAAT family n=1 Tax=Paracidovorax konjaci TaxID=32040 RepID=A0A1I1VQD6_9BURK|nr:ABC transporter ATP-binding protein [Paracidovorax konjaci]SFD85161.1 amino acid/amide ABC transporter ATP-binding protein 2, HAAT family [Paracidovorax konjaci]
MAAQDTGTPLLRLEGVHVHYLGAIAALQGVTLDVRAGEIHALLGANGAGKSTALRAVSHLLAALRGQVTQGRIAFDGQDVLRASPDALVRRGLVPVLEGRHCFPSLTIEENLVTGGIGGGASRARLAQDLERVYAAFPRLQAKRHTPAGLTSGGEQQMAAIGRALMARPRLLVLDEPSMGLAPRTVEDIFRELARLNREEGLTLLIAEQNSTVALRHAHRATVLDTGRSALQGEAHELRARADIRALYFGQGIAPAEPLPAAGA